MRFQTAFALLIAGLCTFSGAEANIVVDQITAGIQDIVDTIQDLGLDPLMIKREGGSYALPVPVIFNADGFVEDLLVVGLSNIVINDIHYDVLGFVLTFDIEMPQVHASLGVAAGQVTLFGNTLTGEASGSLEILNARVRGILRIGVLGGISVRSGEFDSEIGNINSNLNIVIQDRDLSSYVNGFIGETVLNTLEAHKSEIDELLGIVVVDFINNNILN